MTESLAVATAAGLEDVPDDVSEYEPRDARNVLLHLDQALPEDVLRLFGSLVVAEFWRPDNPVPITQTISWAINARRQNRIKPEPVL